MQHIKDIASSIKPGNGWDAEPPVEAREIQRPTLDQLETTHPLIQNAVDAARAWSERKREGHQDASIILAGPVGTGKTHIARAILWSICVSFDDGTPVAPVGRFYEANELVQALGPESSCHSLIGSNCPILVIDDLGSEQNIPYVAQDYQADELQRRYFKIINYCYSQKVSLVITSNLSLTQMADCVGRRAWSRFQEMAPAGFMVDLSGVPDYRRKRSGRGNVIGELDY